MNERMIGDLFWLIGISVFLICLTIVICVAVRNITMWSSERDDDD